MPRPLRTLSALALALLLAFPAFAQDTQEVTVREIYDVPDENIQALINGGTSLTEEQILTLIASPLEGETVTFTAALLTAPYTSGLATYTDTDGDGVNDNPGRVHAFVRDTSARSSGVEGMTIQIVDSAFDENGLLITDFGVGDVLEITGEVSPFGTVMQVNPTSIEKVAELGPSDALLQPVTLSSTAEINAVIAPDAEQFAQINWENFEALRGQYVRLENVAIESRDLDLDEGRPSFQVSSLDTEAYTTLRAISLRYRNDRSGADDDYPSGEDGPWNTRDDDFVPPPPGSVVNLQGFLVYNGFDSAGQSVPDGAILNIAPWEDSDLEVTETPPVITLEALDFVPGNEAVTIEADVVADPTRTISSATLSYRFLPEASFTEVALAGAGDTYSAQIPAPEDGTFVEYFVSSTDNTDATSTTTTQQYRVLYDGIDSIEDVQINASEGPGASPFAGVTTAMNIEAVVMSNPGTSGLLTIQDDEDLNPWTGIFVELTGEIAALDLQPGDRVTVSEAEVAEASGVTRLEGATLARTSTGTPYAYKTVLTGALAQDAATAEAHEGMALRFEDVIITDVNADGDDAEAGFGEWQFSSDGSEENEVRADDASADIDVTFNVDTFVLDETRDFIQGLWWFSFGNYKLVPESAADISNAVSNEDGAVAGAFELTGAFPNPVRDRATVRFVLDRPGEVRVTVYDVTGRRVATLFDGEAAAQRYDVALDARALASGVYVVQLRSADRTLTQKMVVLR